MRPATGDGGECLTVHQQLRRLAPEYVEAFGPAMPGRQRQVLQQILRCRTPALGGQLFECPDCPGFHYRYHSCNDRHCPQCGQTDADDWLQRQRVRLLLPVPYFLVTFTVPEELRHFIRSNQQTGLDLLFATSARALQELAGNPRRLGAQLGMLGVLHTWSRTLIFHPHLHYLVPGGGLSPDGRRWVPAREKFLLPVKPLGAHIRTRFKERLLQEQPELFKQVPAKAWKRPWIVDSRPAGSGQNALRYLSRYVFKPATNNRKVPQLPDGRLLWRYRESQSGKLTSLKLQPMEFMRRFLQHTLPKGFARVRTFGWLHPAARKRANRVRALLGQAPLLSAAEQETWNPPPDPDLETAATEVKPAHAVLCPHCQKIMRLLGSWHPRRMLLYPNRPP
jgi:hypothetical protein